ncbi:hypothetical protein LCGC14_2892890 [marine sediment metagenome]|uniref:Uncharacterized protein n=1 Tax=marine sediment metagenome TaxID=412755 RepID=A0A0F9A4M2_9ZZZZ
MTEEWVKNRFFIWASATMNPDTNLTVLETIELVKDQLIAEFLADNHNLEIACSMIVKDLNFIYNGIMDKTIRMSIFQESIAALEKRLMNIVNRVSTQKEKWEAKKKK